MNKWIAEFDLEDGDTMPEHMDLEYKGARIDFHCRPLEQEPKTGHWIKGYTFPDGAYWKCDKCNELIKVKIPMRYCNNCGAKMVEPQESEIKDGQ